MVSFLKAVSTSGKVTCLYSKSHFSAYTDERAAYRQTLGNIEWTSTWKAELACPLHSWETTLPIYILCTGSKTQMLHKVLPEAGELPNCAITLM